MKELHIFLAGLGRVGEAFVSLLLQLQEELIERYSLNISITSIGDSQGVYHFPKGLSKEEREELFKKKRERMLPPNRERVLEALTETEAHLFIEATPTDLKRGEPALSFIKEALEHRLHVITANKGPLALAFPLIKRLAQKNQVGLGFSGAVGAALPTADLGRRLLPGRCIGLKGIFTGTTNYILTAMQREKKSLEEALGEAQKMGIAEPDPRLDIEGWDTAAKLVILINAVMNKDCTIEDLEEIQGIESMTSFWPKKREREERVCLVGRASLYGDQEELKASVSPVELSLEDPLYGVEGKNKGVSFHHSIYGPITLLGGQSNLQSTAASMLRDLVHMRDRFS